MVTVAHLLDVCDDPDEVGKGKAVNKRGQFRQFNAYKIDHPVQHTVEH